MEPVLDWSAEEGRPRVLQEPLDPDDMRGELWRAEVASRGRGVKKRTRSAGELAQP